MARNVSETKYWFKGLPVAGLDQSSVDKGATKYWFNGQPLTLFATTGNLYSETVAETGSGNDAVSNTASFSNSILETITLGELSSTSLIFANSILENAPSTDSVSASLIIAGAIIESENVTGSEIATAAFAFSVTEIISATENTFLSAIFASNISEFENAGDEYSGSAYFDEIYFESENLTTALSNNLSAASSFSETIALSDEISNNAVLSTPNAESAESNDTYQSFANYTSAIDDNIHDFVIDDIGVNLVIDKSITDVENASFVISPTLTFNKTVNELPIIDDELSASWIFISDVHDVAQISDDDIAKLYRISASVSSAIGKPLTTLTAVSQTHIGAKLNRAVGGKSTAKSAAKITASLQ